VVAFHCRRIRVSGRFQMAHARRIPKTSPGQSGCLVNFEMNEPEARISRISKVLIDRDQMTTDAVLARRKLYRVALRCGPDVARSRTLQLAVLTAANIANRCFPGAVKIVLEPSLKNASLLLWPSLEQTFGQTLISLLGPDVLISPDNFEPDGPVLLFGDVPSTPHALRVTFDGWVAKVGPAEAVSPLPQREYCSLAGVLAIAELFFSFAEISIEATRRTVGLSLWRPDLDINDPAALGIQVQFLPREVWALGLGHLGNAYLWSLATLPYADPGTVEVSLNDFDRIEPDNADTSLLFDAGDEGSYKTRVCCRWLEARGFRTRLIERPFDSNFRCRIEEPRLALCGFDSNEVRRELATAEFRRVMESGLGGTANNFDTISFHTLPNPRSIEELWPVPTADEKNAQAQELERMARENPAYARLDDNDCGRAALAGKSVAVPFVGAAAATIVLAEAIRLLHGGPAYTDIKLVLSDLTRRFAQTERNYAAQDLAGFKYSAGRVQ
jgi:hypothetical protein